MPSLAFDVKGIPGAQGSKDGFAVKRGGEYTGRVGMREHSKKVAPWRSDVKAAAEAAFIASDTWPSPCRVAVQLVVTFRFLRPRSHYRTGRFAGVLRPDAPHWVTSRACGDTDKIVRSTGDALTASGVIADDVLIAVLIADKVYDAWSGATLTLTTLDTTPNPPP